MLRTSILIALAVALFDAGAGAQMGSQAATLQAAAKTSAPFAPRLPLFFEKNEGQVDQRAGFLARMPNATLYLTGSDAVLVHSAKVKDEASALRMHWVGASTTAVPVGEAEMAARSNYFVGKEASGWHTGVTNFQRVKDSGLYQGVDLVYYGNQEQLEYDLTVQPGASASGIRLQIEGASKVSLDKATGDLVVVDAIGGPLRLLKPVVYQIGENKEKTAISGGYALSANNTVSFVLGDYDHSRELVIDPQVVYSTVFGGTTTPTGTGTSPLNLYTGMTVDSNGFVYLSGVTSTNNLPATAGAFQSGCKLYNSSKLCSNFYVAKFDPTQSGAASLIYATYIGGSSQDENLGVSGPRNGIAVDANGDAYIVGQVQQGPNSWAADFPTTSNAFVQTCPGNGAVSPSCSGFLTKLNASGSGLLYSTWTAGSYTLAEPGMVAVDSNQIAYIAGSNGSGAPGNFLAAFDTTKSGAASFVYSVGLPFSVQTIAADPSGNVYVGGESFQSITENGAAGYQLINLNGANNSVPSGSFPAILVRFNTAGQNTYATLFGDGQFDAVRGVAADPSGIVYVTGNANDLVQVNGLPSGAGGTQGAFVAEVDTTLTGTASVPFSSYIYAGDISNETFAVASNGAGQFAFAGIAVVSATYPLTNPLTQPVAFPTQSPSNPQFVGIIDPSKSGQSRLTFLSYLDGVDEAFTLFFNQGSIGGNINNSAVHASVQAIGVPNYNLFVAGYGLEGLVNNPFLTGSTLASYSTSVSAAQEIVPFFYKIALGPIDCLTISPNSLVFPGQTVNTTSLPLSFSVANSCSTAVSLDSVTASAQFKETDNCTPSLLAGQSCTVNVTFAPTAVSPSVNFTLVPTTGLISINATGSNAPLSEAVSGVGVSAGTPTGFLFPQSIAFAPQPTGTTSAPVTVTLTNTGSAVLGNGVNNMIVLSTSAFVPFSVKNNSCGTSLGIGLSCQFQVVFAPNSTTAQIAPSGNYSNSITVNGPTPTISMPLTGTGTAAAPIVSLSPNSLTFPSTIVHGSNEPQTVTLTNTGSATLTINSVNPGGSNAGSFIVGGTCATIGIVSVNGTCTVLVTFNPQATGPLSGLVTITDNANPGTQIVTFTGTGASSTPTTPVITWATPAAITYGTALSGAQLDASTTVAGTFAYTPASGVLTAGTQTLSVLFTPTDTVAYTTVTASVQLTVNKATPVISWATPANISYGTALSGTQLNATSSVAGTFAYTPASGVLAAGVHTLSVLFTPTDTTDYTTATGTVQLTVGQVTPTITWATPAAITYGTALSGTQLNASSSVSGTFAYTPASGVLTAGTQTLSVLFTPTDTTDYTTATGSVQLVVSKVTPTITWATPAAITYGTALSGTQLNASAPVAGTFSYSASGVLTAGTHTVSVLFTPTDTTDYTTAGAQVSVLVNRATLTVSANNASKAAGAANPAFSASYSGFVNGDTAAVLSGAPVLSTTATSSSAAGTYPITVAQGTLTAANYTFVFVNGTLSVVAAPTVVLTTTATLSKVTNGYQAVISITNSGTGPATNVTLTSATLGSAVGSTLPQNLGTLAAGSTITYAVSFPSSAGNSGTAVAEKYSGTYTGGSFGASVRAVTLP